MARVAKVAVDLEANSAKFTAGLGRADRAMASSGAKWKRELSSTDKAMVALSSRMGVLFGVAAVAALGRFAKGAIDAVGGLGELADQTGVSTDMLQIMGYAAAQSGVKVEELNKGLAKLTDTIGAAVNGEKIYEDSFKSLGVALRDVNGQTRTTEAILFDVAEAYKSAGDKTRAFALVKDILGRSGSQLIPILKDGKAGLEDWAKAAHEAGAVIDKDLIDSADKLSDYLAGLGTSLNKYFGSEIASLVLSARYATGLLTGDLTMFTDTQKETMIGEIEKKLFDLRGTAALIRTNIAKHTGLGSAQELAAVTAEMGRLNQQAIALRDSMAPKDTGIPTGGGGEGPTLEQMKQTEAIDKQLVAMRFQEEQLKRNAREQAIYSAVQQANVEITSEQGIAISAAAASLYDATTAHKDALATLEELNDAERQYIDAQYEADAARERINVGMEQEIANNEQLIAAMRVSETEYERVAAMIDLMNQYRAAGIEMTPQEIAQAEVLTDKIGEQRAELDKLKAATESAKKLGADMGMTFSSAFEDAIVSGRKFSDVLRGLAQDVMRLLMRQTVSQPMASGFSSLFGSVASSLFSGFGGGTSYATAGTTGAFGPSFAGGGDTGNAPRSGGLDGQGGFLAMLHPQEDVIDRTLSSNTESGPSGGTFIIDARGADRQGFAQLQNMIAALNGSIEQRAVAAVVNASKRGGAGRKALA